MEIDSAKLDHNGECIEDISTDQLLTLGSPDTHVTFGDPQILPRIGDQYQVEIPPLTTEFDRLQLIKNSTDVEVMVNVGQSFLTGLPIPIRWTHDKVDNIKCEPLEFVGIPDNAVDTNGSAEQENSMENQIHSNGEGSKLKLELSEVALGYGKETVVIDQMDVNPPLKQPKNSNMDQKSGGNGRCPFPCSSDEPWSNIEQKSFILGLYIFGKNLVQIKRFIEKKEMGDILSFYYGKFYRSDGHRKWSECRKIRSRKCIHGQRIFTGWRQQELLSRLLPHVSEECQKTLLEVSKTFGEGKISLEEYVCTLKTTVGMNMLIEAVGIGKEKQDLTSIVLEPSKSNHVIATRPEIPVGKACSSLTSGDIIKFLTGDFRLSKARSNDLFWEAVWPRLLARGWQSEQPKNQGYAGSKPSLVFLIPGIKKFSRRRHVKGNHYFDSVSDVLNKVVNEPRLLDLEAEAAKVSGGKEEYEFDTQEKLGRVCPYDHQQHCYLRSYLSNCNSDLKKFTIVDTSLVDGEEPSKVKELVSLPADTTKTSMPMSSSKEIDGVISEESKDQPDYTDMLSNDQGDIILKKNDKGDINSSKRTKDMIDRGVHSDLSDCVSSVFKQEMPFNAPGHADVPMDNHKKQCTNISNDKHPKKTVKCQFSRMEKPSLLNYLTPVMKRRRLTCSTETNRSMENFSQPDSLDAGESMVSRVAPSLEKVSSNSSLAKNSPDESGEGVFNGSCFGTAESLEKSQFLTFIDLNLPYATPDYENGGFTGVADNQDDTSAKGSHLPSVVTQQLENSETLRTSNGGPSEEQQPVVNARRQSTRNRPLTTRALEALESEFLNTRRRRNNTKVLSRENSIPRPSRCRSGVATNFGNIGIGNVDSRVLERVDGVCHSNSSLVNKSQVCSERKGALELLGVPKPSYHPDVLVCKENQSC